MGPHVRVTLYGRSMKFKPGAWPLHPNEAHRMRLLSDLRVLDTELEVPFDRITQIAKVMFDVPICLITLIDDRRQWFKSCIGLDVRETGRDVAFCAHAILPSAPDVFIIKDALLDKRFSD